MPLVRVRVVVLLSKMLAKVLPHQVVVFEDVSDDDISHGDCGHVEEACDAEVLEIHQTCFVPFTA